MAETLYPRLTLAEIKVARGEYDQAHDLLAAIASVELGEDPRFLGPLHTTRAELALGEKHLPEAIDEVKRGLEVVRGTENSVELLRLCAVGLRATADRATQKGATEADRTSAKATGDWLAHEASGAAPKPPTAETTQLVLLGKAERQRIQGTDTAALWRKVAAGWTKLDRPYPAAYARFREAAAAARAGDKAGARQIVRGVHQVVTKLRAEPLRVKVAALAKGVGVDVGRAPRIERPYNLTEAELETLRLVAEGKDAAGIAAARNVSPRTAETQRQNVYKKLGVRSAFEAVALTNKEGLLD